MPNANDTEALIQRLRGEIGELAPADALRRQAAGALLLDVREESERAAGMPVGAQGLSRGFLELQIDELEPDRDREILTLCHAGIRSLLAARTLRQLGYTNVRSVAGGYARWQQEGLPIEHGGALDADAAERYARQINLPGVGVAGQRRLAAARIALVGAGGLGAPAALYLAAAGVGEITLIDDDRVERSNLQRQIIHADARVGMAKTESARIALAALNPRVRVELHDTRLRAANVEQLVAGHDVIIDGADNFPTRYLLTAASIRLKTPLVYGALERFSGQVSVFDPRDPHSPCYRCLYPQPPDADAAPNCSAAGVLGVLPGLVGLLQATETLKLLLGLGTPLVGQLLLVDVLTMDFRKLRLPRNPDCPGCGANAKWSGYTDLEEACAGR